jgi:hypothetical protein
VSLPWEVRSFMIRLPGTVALGVLLASLILCASDVRASPSHQDDDDPQLMGVALARTNPNGQWAGQWLGAHRYTRDGGLYVVAFADTSWSQLQQALAAAGPTAVYLLGEVPYVGDGTCAPGAWRLWWRNGQLTADGRGMGWEPAPVPASAPAVACPANLFPEAGLVLRLAGDAPTP